MRSLLPKIVEYIEADITKSHIFYFRSVKSVISPDVLCNLKFDLNCQIDLCESWEDMIVRFTVVSKAIDSLPILLLIDADMIISGEASINEVIDMISTLNRCMRRQKLKFAVIIENAVSSAFIKELQSTEILGIVPCADKFGYEHTLEALKQLFAGHSHWPRDIINSVTVNTVTRPVEVDGITLTARQKQVLDLVCNRGLPNKKIAQILKISESTVKIHVSAILKEYGVRNRTQLALAARADIESIYH